MNYYERIQRSIDYFEDNLEEELSVEEGAKEAYMSLSNYHRLFFALVGYSAKEYIRLRRVSLAAKEIKEKKCKVIDVAVKYGYESGDAFSRTFKNVTGFLPSKYGQNTKNYVFGRIDVMEKYFDKQTGESMEQYPDIKVLKELEPMRVAYYCYYGKEPEDGAFKVLCEWIKENHIDIQKEGCRIFGYNAPGTIVGDSEYGYEVCLTLPPHIKVEDERVKEKQLEGGLYAITSISPGGDLGENIMKGWKRFENWISGSKYALGDHQWLEEHLGFNDELEHVGGVDLYMPIVLKQDKVSKTEFQTLEPVWTVSYTAKGRGAENKARKFLFEWAQAQGINLTDKSHRVFAYYNFDKVGTAEFFYTLNITVEEAFSVDNTEIKKAPFPGGYYAVREVLYARNGQSWGEFMDWVNKNETYTYGKQWFFEEYVLEKPLIDGKTLVKQYMPIREKAGDKS